MLEKISAKILSAKVFILLVLSVVTRFAFFGHPNSVVFDEVYFADFINRYLNGTYFFDIHPPLAKILFVAFGNIFGLNNNLNISAIGNILPESYISLRILSIIAGILLPIVIYFICKKIKLSENAAFLAGILIIFESSIMNQSRFILLDSLLLLFGFTALYLFLSSYNLCGDESPGGKSWFYLLTSAFFASCSMGVKWTGASFAGIIIVLLLFKYRHSELLRRLIAFIFVFVITYVIFFIPHFALLKNSGPGDAFMSVAFNKTLIGSEANKNAENNKNIIPLGFIGKFVELNVEMYKANAGLSQSHPYSSEWYSWPFMYRPIYYWNDPEGRMIYLFGNPFIYILATLSMIALIFFRLFGKIWKTISTDQKKVSSFILLGFFANYLPFIFIGRVMFLYHYFTALIFAIIAIVFLADNVISVKKKNMIMLTVAFVAIVFFLYFSPILYGLKADKGSLESRFWISSWR